MKTKIVLSLCAALAVALSVTAQDPGVYTLARWNGDSGVDAAIAPATSVTNTLSTSEYNSGKLMFSLKANTASTANVIIRTYRSLDSSNYETTATTNLVALNGTSVVFGVIDLSESYLANNGVLRVALDNTNAATVSITNIVGRVRFNAPSLRIKGN